MKPRHPAPDDNSVVAGASRTVGSLLEGVFASVARLRPTAKPLIPRARPSPRPSPVPVSDRQWASHGSTSPALITDKRGFRAPSDFPAGGPTSSDWPCVYPPPPATVTCCSRRPDEEVSEGTCFCRPARPPPGCTRPSSRTARHQAPCSWQQTLTATVYSPWHAGGPEAHGERLAASCSKPHPPQAPMKRTPSDPPSIRSSTRSQGSLTTHGRHAYVKVPTELLAVPERRTRAIHRRTDSEFASDPRQ